MMARFGRLPGGAQTGCVTVLTGVTSDPLGEVGN